MKVATRLAWAFGLFIAILVGLLAYHVRTIRDAVSTSYELSKISERLALSASDLAVRIDEMEEFAGKFWVTRDPGYSEKFAESVAAFDAGLRRLADYPLDTREREAVEDLAKVWAAFLPVAEAVVGPVRPRTVAASPRTDPIQVLYDHLERLRVGVRTVGEASQQVMDSHLDRSAEAARSAERVSWGAVVAALLLATLISGFLVRSISDALGRLEAGTREVANGNFAYRLDIRRNDEFARLARDFNVMTRRLGELDQMKRDFLSKVSHDLKTPLASIREATRLLLEEVPGPLTDRQRRLLDLNHQSAERLSAMIAKILELSAMEAGVLDLDVGSHDLVALIHETLEEMGPAARERGIALSGPADDAPIVVECDGERVRRVLVNLVENAIKFSPAGAKVDVAARFLAERPADVPPARWKRIDPRGALITVADEGPGIPDPEKEQIFERFFQSETGRRVHGRGVGLGLTICREIVDAHNGALWVSDRPGGGSIFSVLLPGTRPAERTATAAPVAAAAGRG